MENQPDSAVMERVQRGETEQLGILFERYHAPLFRYLLQLSRNRALSEDLVQEVFFRALKYAGSYDPNLTFSVWLFRMGRNAYFDSLKKHSNEVLGAETEGIGSSELMPEEVYSRKENESLLQEALHRLSEEKREVLVLSRFQDLRYQEIAQILKCEVGTVKIRVYRALRELRERFCELKGQSLYDA